VARHRHLFHNIASFERWSVNGAEFFDRFVHRSNRCMSLSILAPLVTDGYSISTSEVPQRYLIGKSRQIIV
jgi:hypothetical protein